MALPTFFADYMQRLEDLHHDFAQAITGVPQAGLDWAPGPDMNSLCVLVAHTTGAARYWVSDVALGDDSHRDRDAEFRAHGLSEVQLKDKITQVEDYIRGVLSRLSLDDLAAPRTSPRFQPREFTVGWAILHALEHTGLHLGHAQITRQLWDQRA